jgi:pimeloyl-ACP methyl ester carboxylesterase
MNSRDVGEDMDISEQSRLTLRDGRVIGFCEVGDPEGKSVFYFHGFPGSRLEVKWIKRAAEQLHLRIIGIDRPGYGLSDFKPDRTIGDWPQDVAELADALNLPRFVAVGVSGGGPYAASCALKIPERLTAAGIVCGLGQTDLPGATHGMTPINRLGFSIGKNAPWMLKLLFLPGSVLLRCSPELILQMIDRHLEEPDRRVVKQPDMRRILKRSFREAVRQGPSGAVHDLLLYSRPWDVPLQNIDMEVYLWHGMRDTIVPHTMGLQIKKSIPRCRAAFLPDEGHFSLLYDHMTTILAALTGNPKAGKAIYVSHEFW